jgi:hypothetical protein
MKTSKINSVYFSATRTTRSIIRHIAQQLECERVEYDITQNTPEIKKLLKWERTSFCLLVFLFMLVVFLQLLTRTSKIQRHKNACYIVCVYGNRVIDYDDALLELNDVVEANGFKVISAGAFIAQLPYFHKLGQIVRTIRIIS